VTYAKTRKKSGWYGDQQEEHRNLDRTIARSTLAKKASCSLEEIKGPGIYILVHTKTNKAYVGQSKFISERLLQHVITATSGKEDILSKFQHFLQENINIDEWELTIIPCPKEDLDKMEYEEWIRLRKKYDLLNVRSPPKPK